MRPPKTDLRVIVPPPAALISSYDLSHSPSPSPPRSPSPYSQPPPPPFPPGRPRGAPARRSPRPATPDAVAYAPYPAPTRTLLLLFAFTSPHDFIHLMLPALALSMVTGGTAPFMTQVVGTAFDAFASLPASELLDAVGKTSLELGALAVAALTLSALSSSFWVRLGERNVRLLREVVFTSVVGRSMDWFDLEMTRVGGDAGAGGMMAEFTRDTDEVRLAVSINFGALLEHSTTVFIALVLAFRSSPKLTGIIIISIPAVMIVQIFCEILTTPRLALHSALIARAASGLASALTNISTVKAFSAAPQVTARLSRLLDSQRGVHAQCAFFWALSAGSAQFILMGMFVSAFWFGAQQVKQGNLSPGEVMSVFWACLVASSNLQMCVPLSLQIGKARSAADRLWKQMEPQYEDDEVLQQWERENPEGKLMRNLVQRRAKSKSKLRSDPEKAQASMSSLHKMTGALPLPTTPRTATRPNEETHLPLTPKRSLFLLKPHPLPAAAAPAPAPEDEEPKGSVEVARVSFTYASRPDRPVLSDVSVFFPAGELTFVVGGSGSGKSTLASLMVGMYTPQQGGAILYDDVPLHALEDGWIGREVCLVQQGGGVVFDCSMRENVAMSMSGRGRGRGREEAVEKACRLVMLHEFVMGLPEGYETMLGSGATQLSGGQKQRLALARARVRNPAVLILDEATSALDPASRLLVFSALRRWRIGKTTIVITHDLSQLAPNSFAYVLAHGRVVEQGFRRDLETVRGGEFARMCREQAGGGGGARVRSDLGEVDVREMLGGRKGEAEAEKEMEVERAAARRARRATVDAIKGVITGRKRESQQPVQEAGDGDLPNRSKFRSLLPAPRANHSSAMAPPRRGRHASALPPTRAPPPQRARQSPSPNNHQPEVELPPSRASSANSEGFDADYLLELGGHAARKRPGKDYKDIWGSGGRARWNADRIEEFKRAAELAELKQAKEGEGGGGGATGPTKVVVGSGVKQEPLPTICKTIRKFWPGVPRKWQLAISLVVALGNGAITPLFSFFLAKLLAQVALGAAGMDYVLVTQVAETVLCLAAADGVTMAVKVFTMETLGMRWVDSLRTRSVRKVLLQDKAWHDAPAHSTAYLIQTLMKDADDAQYLLTNITPQSVTVITMFSGALVWAMIVGWQLTLVGFALAPLFSGAMSVQTGLVGKFEMENRVAREEIAKRYYEAVFNIRAIRGLGLEVVFRKQFCITLDKAVRTGSRRAWVAGCGFGLINALIYSAEAVLFVVGAKLIAVGLYDYAKMVEVMSLVVFSITNGGQILTFVPRIAASLQATNNFGKLLDLDIKGTIDRKPGIKLKTDGDIRFETVCFSYPQRPDNPILKHLSFTVRPRECVAIVGASGSGKSTIAALLQRMYEPTSGCIYLARQPLSNSDVAHLRERTAVVSQHPALFDMTVKENITYGAPKIPLEKAQIAAREANVHDFIMSLPQGYDTPMGENGALISGGQAQRLQIARALVRDADILILDECTSALDAENESAVMNTIMNVKRGRTTLMITHKLPIMKACDRIILLHDGAVAEEGTYDSLMRRRGLFFTLATAGEWASD